MYYTPTEILDRNPNLKKIWNHSDIGYLLRLRLVRGRKIKSTHSCEVLESDVLELLNLYKEK